MQSVRNSRSETWWAIIVVVFLLISILELAGCGGGGGAGGGISGGGGGGFGTSSGAALTAVQMTPAQATMAVGEKLKLTTTGVYSDNSHQDIGQSCKCTSSNPDIVLFDDSTETATALKVGTATITAKDPSTGLSGSSTITVTGATLSSMQITPTNPTIAVGTTTSFVVTGINSDNTTYVMTPMSLSLLRQPMWHRSITAAGPRLSGRDRPPSLHRILQAEKAP